ncbi:polysaccharide deacetylase family protein [Saccharibacillus sp. JS10]|uniref:polysaccharide deacetylase family protein n=1 Tax=Saccharibacillus sp. JS10 TaxID=2950552 RepID=UPI00210D9500|nr:polysaccharide deacetylase family protein [Saccharibacillus sp. JS10]MCQ4085815.1 polysaccharide deacetylase family protein [Saccharibacillus sp. JS10]
MWKKTAMFWLAAGIVLGACGSTADEPKAANSEQTQESQPATSGETSTDPQAASPSEASSTEETNEPAAQNPETAAAPDSTPATSSETVDETTPTDQEADDSGDTAEAAEVPIEYHMNANYDIVPNEDSDAPKKVVLLTFDDGPKEAEMIDGLFDTLDKHNAKAIFFVNGYRVKQHPELLKLIQERGGIIGNHSYDHIYLNKQTDAEIKKQIESVQTIVEDTIGEAPQFFRPPNAAGNDYAHQVAKENGLLYMTWSVGSLDWVNQNDPKAVVDNVFDQLHAGSNILMHELPWTVEALDDLLTKLEAKGYGFVDPRAIDTTKQP